MAQKLQVAFLWHFHQPQYFHPEEEVPTLPWVRLHAVRGYSDMVALLEELPQVGVTLNWVPVLVEQLQDLCNGHEDLWLRLCRKAPADLEAAQREFLCEHLFSAQREQLIAPLSRYDELCRRVELAGSGAVDFSDQELLDLQVLFHLAWSGFRVRRRAEVRALLQKQRDFSIDDRDALLAIHEQEIRELLPRVQRLASSGVVELSATPYQHPIAPLVAHLDSRDFAHAGGDQDPFQYTYPDDARDHIQRGVAAHRRTFGAPPQGMWPAEGAVSEQTAALFAEAGLRWIATDEEILFRSLPAGADRDELYRPHRLQTPAGELAVFFRDHELSDRLGFVYQSWDPEEAVNDLLHRLDRIRQESGHECPVVSLILDGENPWEHYPAAGEPFLRTLYQKLAEHPHLQATSMHGALEGRQEDLPRLPQLACGSWIHGNLDTWAGQPGKLQGWRLLQAARAAAGPQRLDEMPTDLAQSLRVLEGSDWYWWFGDDHFTSHPELFDELFRAHLRRVYRLLDREAPAELQAPLHPGALLHPHRLPLRSIAPRGVRGDFLEWRNAGFFEVGPAGTAMSRASRPVQRLLFGFEDDQLHLAVVREARDFTARVVVNAGQERVLEPCPDLGTDLPWLRFSVALPSTAGTEVSVRVELDLGAGESWIWPTARTAVIAIPSAAERLHWLV